MIWRHGQVARGIRWARQLYIFAVALASFGAASPQGVYEVCDSEEQLIVEDVRLSPHIPQPTRQLNVTVIGRISETARPGAFNVTRLRAVGSVFFCRRINDCMPVFEREAPFCRAIGREDGACAVMEPDERFTISTSWHLPLLIMRGTYNLHLQFVEERPGGEPDGIVGCCWFNGISVVAWRFVNIMRDYRDAFVAFGVAATSSRALGAFLPSFSGGMLPQISGFLFMGILVGPYAANLVSHLHIVLIGDVINRVSLAFIAGAAGAEIFLPELKSLLVPICLQVVLISVATLIFCTAGLVILSDLSFVNVPFISDQPTAAARWVVALLCAVLMTARSPASAIGVISELGCSHLQVAKVTIGVTVVGDIVVLVLFALSMKLTRLVTEGGHFEFSVACEVGVEIFVSMLLGLCTGQLLRFILPARPPETQGAYDGAGGQSENREKILLAVRGLLLLGILYATFLAAEEAVEWSRGMVRLEPLLACITAACVSGHDEARREQLLAALSYWTPLVLLPFFTLAGASLVLPSLFEVMMAAVALVLLRMLGVACGSALAGVISARYSPELRITGTAIRCTWLTMLAQAGVTLGLVLEVKSNFPSWSKNFGTLVIGVVVLNQMLGPVMCRIGIQRVAAAEKAEKVAMDGKHEGNFLAMSRVDSNASSDGGKLENGHAEASVDTGRPSILFAGLRRPTLGSSYTRLSVESPVVRKGPRMRSLSDPSVRLVPDDFGGDGQLSLLGSSYTTLYPRAGLPAMHYLHRRHALAGTLQRDRSPMRRGSRSPTGGARSPSPKVSTFMLDINTPDPL